MKRTAPIRFGDFTVRAALSDHRLLVRAEGGALAVVWRLERLQGVRETRHDIDHPNVVPIVDGGVDFEGRSWLAMPLVLGVSLTRLARKLSVHGSRFPPAVACRVVRDVLVAIAAYQRSAAGLHGALGPDSVLVTFRGDAVVLDDGAARRKLALRRQLGDPSADVAAAIRLLAEMLEPQARVPTTGPARLAALDVSRAEAPLPVQAWLQQAKGKLPAPLILAQQLETACPALLDAQTTQAFLAEVFPGLEASVKRLMHLAADLGQSVVTVESALGRLGEETEPEAPGRWGWVAAAGVAAIAVGVVSRWPANEVASIDAGVNRPGAEAAALARAEQLVAAQDLSGAMVALRDCRGGEEPCPLAEKRLAQVEALALTRRQADPVAVPPPPMRECDPVYAQRLIDQLDWETAAAELRNCFEPGTTSLNQAAQERLAAIEAGGVERCLLQEAQRLLGQKQKRAAHWLVRHVEPSVALRVPRQALLAHFGTSQAPGPDELVAFALERCMTQYPHNANGWLLLGEANERLSPGVARRAYDRFLSLAPVTHSKREFARQRLDRLMR